MKKFKVTIEYTMTNIETRESFKDTYTETIKADSLAQAVCYHTMTFATCVAKMYHNCGISSCNATAEEVK